MKRKLILGLCLAVTLGLLGTALAEPVLTDGHYTAWLGENNNLFLVDEAGAVKTMSTPMADLVGMDEENLYCLTRDTGRLYAIRLDGSASSIVSLNPTEEDFAACATSLPYTLQDGTLNRVNADSTTTPIATGVLAASSNGENIFYVTQPEGGQPTLTSVPVTVSDTPVVQLTQTVSAPLSMIATPGYVTIVTESHAVQVVNLLDWSLTEVPAASESTMKAACIDGTLYRYTQDENGRDVYEHALVLFAAATASPTVQPTTAAVASITAQPTATVRPTATPRPTATARPTAKPTSSSNDDGTLRLGSSGYAIRGMQQRLSELGYPTGKIDGVFGDDTLYAVHLFQSAAGYTEHSYMTEKMLKKLNASNAPTYDPYLPLRLNSRGTYVLLMQTRLLELGYDPGKLDGVYGKNTVAAAKEFQLVAGFVVDESNGKPKQGEEMTREMLILLYDEENAPAKPTPTPIPTATPVPTETPVPTAVPTEAPTTEPTSEPTTEPTTAPTTEPTTEPTPNPTEKPTQNPDDVTTATDLKAPET